MNTASLRSALKRALEIIDNPHYHDSCGSRPADHPAVDDIREALNIGYSHSGSGDLGYMSDETWSAAKEMYDAGKSETQARLDDAEDQLRRLREALREPMAELFGVHPDDMKRRI